MIDRGIPEAKNVRGVPCIMGMNYDMLRWRPGKPPKVVLSSVRAVSMGSTPTMKDHIL